MLRMLSSVERGRHVCPECGADQPNDATFCGACGARVHRGRQGSRGVMVVLAFFVAGLVALAGAAGYLQYRTQSTLDVARDDLATVGEALADAKDEIAQAEERMNRRKAKLAMAQEELDEKTRSLRAVNQSLAAARVRESGLESTLDDAFSQLDLQASQIETLKTCLDGVSNAFVYVWNFEDDEALASLLAVEVSCKSSFELFE